MNKEELEKYIEKDFLPSLLSNLPNIPDLASENARLKAENERLRLQVGTDAIDREHGMCCDSSAENARLKAEVERLRKAGDALAKVIPDIMDYRFDGNECDKELKAWLAAKEGKQP